MACRIAYAACRGTYHIQKGIPCQDAVTGGRNGDVAVAVLADGAGSRPHSQLGAETVVRTIFSFLTDNTTAFQDHTETFSTELISVCLKALSSNAVPVEDQACTLLFCAVRSDGQYFCGHIGDGYIFWNHQKHTELLSDSENGNTLSETVFVTSPHASDHLRMKSGRLLPGESLILCSDGAGEGLYERLSMRCAPAVAELTRWLQHFPENDVSKAIYNNLDEVFRKQSHDDMSLALVLYAEPDEANAITEENPC